jgi:Na+/melibiose symporter-like transporter
VSDKPTRRDLLRPVQLLGLAALAAVFAGFVTLMTMGFFQAIPGEDRQQVLVVGAIVAGITFIATLLILSLLLLAVDPAQVTKTVDRPVLLPQDPPTDEAPDADGPDAPRS